MSPLLFYVIMFLSRSIYVCQHVGPTSVPTPPTCVNAISTGKGITDETDPNNLEPTETACGGIFMFRREIYEKVGAFDPDLFLYHEDHDLSWRIRLFGWKMRTTPKAEIYHHYHFNKGVFKYYSSEKNRLFL